MDWDQQKLVCRISLQKLHLLDDQLQHSVCHVWEVSSFLHFTATKIKYQQHLLISKLGQMWLCESRQVPDVASVVATVCPSEGGRQKQEERGSEVSRV